MQSELTTEKTFANQQETIAYLEQSLVETLRDAALEDGSDVIHMTGIDATTHELAEVGGDATRVSTEAIAFLQRASEHHVGVVITTGTSRLSIKISPHSCRLTLRRHPDEPAAAMPVAQQSDSQGQPSSANTRETGASSPRSPGLSSGVPAINPIPTSTSNR